MIFLFLIFSVLAGALVMMVFKPKQEAVRLLLAFSGAYLLAVTILHLLPEVYENTSAKNHSINLVGLFVLGGILIQSILESFSKGAEHGHIHLHSDATAFPWMLLISLSIHAFSEGIPVGYADNSELLWAIVVHKIPISIVLATFLLQSKLPKTQGYLFIVFFAMMSPLGALLAKEMPLLLSYHTQITALTIGIFLHISTVILFESSKDHKFNIRKFIAILFGMSIAYFG
jgi:zinc and cadmium transporter